MRKLLIRCYPARWRIRYGDEFEGLLEERALGPFDVADVLLGALDAHLRLRGHPIATNQGKGMIMSLRIGGIAAVLGAALLAVAGFLGSGLVDVDSAVAAILMFAGLAMLLVAVAGLSAFQARVAPRLIWTAFALIAVGTITGVVGFVGTLQVGEPYWGVWFLGLLTALIGSALFAIATYRTDTLSRGGAVLLGVGSVLPFLTLGIQPVMLAAILCFLLGWFALGVQAIRLDRPATAPRPA